MLGGIVLCNLETVRQFIDTQIASEQFFNNPLPGEVREGFEDVETVVRFHEVIFVKIRLDINL